MTATLAQAKRWVKRNNESIFDKLNVVHPESPEFQYLWEELGKHKLNKKLEDPCNADNFGEAWQYMYTDKCSFMFFWKRDCHVFRHRCHPKTNKAERLEIPVSKSFSVNN